jgi:hypothetical protein
METALFMLYNHDSVPTRKSDQGRIISNYYPIVCMESKRTKTVKYNYQGRVNDPNIVFHPPADATYGKLVLNYQAVQLCLCPMYESMAEFPFLALGGAGPETHGAIVIEHRPLTNGPALYSCFFLTNVTQSPAASQPIERLFQFNDSMKQAYQSEPFYVAMNDYIAAPPRSVKTEHQGRPCLVLFYGDPIPVHFPTMRLVGGEAPRLLLGNGPEGFVGRNAAAAAPVREGATALSNMISLDFNGNPHGFGLNVKSCGQNNSGNPPDLSNLPVVRNTYSGEQIKQRPNAMINSDERCKVFDIALQGNMNDPTAMQNFVNEVFQYRKMNDGLNPYLGKMGNMDCYTVYMNNFWGGEQNFLDHLIQLGVTLPPQYNYWNAAMVNNGFDPASIGFNLDAMCYDVSTVEFNTGRAQGVGYDYLRGTVTTAISDVSAVMNTAFSGITGAGKTTLDILTGQVNVAPTKGPSVLLQVPILDSPDVTYQECTMIPADEAELEPVYLTSQAQYLNQYNSLFGIIFYFILFLLFYFGVPFLYYFVMCNILKRGFNYSGTATFSEYLRKPQNFLGLGKNRGISILFNVIYWIVVLVVWAATLIPGANVNQLNSVVILMIIGWIIGYIGVKNNPPPESCFF